MATAVGRNDKLHTAANASTLSYTNLGDIARCHAVDDRERHQHQPVSVWGQKDGSMIRTQGFILPDAT